MEKKIVVIGSIGNTERQNRDDMRVIGRGGADVYIEISYRQRPSASSEEI